MVKLNNLLTLLCVSSLYTVVSGKEKVFEGECLDLYNALGERFSINSCEIDENGNGNMISLDIVYDEEVLTQNDIEIISSYSNLQELKFTRFGAITDVNMESLHVPKVTFYDLKKLLHSKASKFRDNTFTPEVLKTVKNVDTLELDGYQITQSTIDALSTLTNVKEMLLTDSGFDENLDFSSLRNAKTLTYLFIEHYSKAQSLGGFPESICKIKQLKRLDLFSKVTAIPSCINNLRKLEYLDLNNNEISEIPNEIGGLSKLTHLDLNTNSITELPDGFGGLSKLKYLDLRYNSISTFSSALCELSSIETLDLGDNGIPKIPSCIKNLSNLKDLYLNDNAIESISSSFYNLKNLVNLDLSSNKISKISSNIKNLKNLKTLNLYDNNISVIPDNIGKLVNLVSLSLSGNNNIVEIPDSLKKLVNLENLNLSGSKIGVIPKAIGKLVNLDTLTISGSLITEIPDFIGNLTKLRYLDLTYNEISVIPKAIVNLINLLSLDLSSNAITDLPEYLGNLTKLEKLDLGYNKIDAVIPESYNNLEALTSISLSGNVDIRGKTLTNPNIIGCDYNEKTNKSENGLCIAKDSRCVPFNVSLPDC